MNDISDHFPCLTYFENLTEDKRNEPTFKEYRKKPNHINTGNFLSKLRERNFDHVKDPAINIVNKFEMFDSIFFETYAEEFPLKTSKVIKKNYENPWVNKELKAEIKRKHELHKLYLSKTIPVELYKNFKASLGKKIIKAKREYFSKNLECTANNIKQKWQFLNKVLNRKVTSNISPTTIVADKKSYDNVHEISGKFGEHFSTIGEKVSHNQNSNINPLDYLKNISHDAKFEFQQVSLEDVEKAILSLRNKGCNVNSIPNYIYKISVPIIAPLLKDLINESLQLGVFPSIYNCATVLPLYKSGCRKNMNNYRPISILPTTSKIIEKVVNKQIVNYFDAHSLFSNFQFGFRKKHSTQDTNNLLMEHIYNKLNNKSNILITFLDLKKAFDSVNLDILLAKLKYYGLDDTSLNWFSTYLKNRRLAVRINNHLSDPYPINVSVPQGSILGPTLFNIFINDFEYSHKATSFQYADDTTIISDENDYDKLESATNESLKSINEWLISNKLAPNLFKTVYMLITNKKRREMNIIMNNLKLVEVESYKSLGLLIDNRLSFKNHCTKVANSLSKVNYMLYKNKYFLDLKTKIQLYYSLAYPHLIYNNVIWGNAPSVYLNKVFVAQKRIIRNIIGNNNASASAGLINLKILSVPQIFEHQCILYMYKIRNSTCPQLINLSIEKHQIIHSHNTRRKNDYRTPLFKTAISQNAFSYQGPKFWNSLPPGIKNLHCSNPTFAKIVKNFILGKNDNFS